MDDNDITDGYLDGFRARTETLENGGNRSESYRFGWNNGHDDRLRRPRASADAIRIEGASIEARAAAYRP